MSAGESARRTGATRVPVLCVDDEPNVLEGLKLHLERHFEVLTATGGADGLACLERRADIAVVISDMRMPQMDGAEFLARARDLRPDATRLLLTGHADLASALACINDVQVFRFLTKPCAPAALLAEVRSAAERHRLVTAERVLLEQTLHGSVRMLVDVLALTHPLAFGRATRLRQHVEAIAGHVTLEPRWPVEVAAMLSQVGAVTLAPETVQKLHRGEPLSAEEERRVARLPDVVEQLIAHVPRLETVRAIIRNQNQDAGPVPNPHDPAIVGARVLRLAADFDTLASRGLTPARALDTLRGRDGAYDQELLEAFARAIGAAGSQEEIRELPIREVEIGMVFADDVVLANGTLLVARGYEVTASFVERTGNYRAGAVKEPVRVIVRSGAAPGRAA